MNNRLVQMRARMMGKGLPASTSLDIANSDALIVAKQREIVQLRKPLVLFLMMVTQMATIKSIEEKQTELNRLVDGKQRKGISGSSNSEPRPNKITEFRRFLLSQ